MTHILLACDTAPAEHDSVDSVDSADTAVVEDLVLVPQITHGDTPVQRVRWSTPEPTTGRVEYGVDGLDRVAEDDVVGTEHDVIVAGIAAGYGWQLRVVSEAGGTRWESDLVNIEAVSAPIAMPLPILAVPPAEGVEGFELMPLPAKEGAYIAMLNRLGEAVWWSAPSPQFVYRARYDSVNHTVTWVAASQSTGEQTFITSTLDGEETRVAAPISSHADFTFLPDGGFLVLALEDRDVDGQRVRGETLQEVSPDGTTRQIWNSWDQFSWSGGGHVVEGKWIEWPHANSISYDSDSRKVFVSLFYLDAVAQIDRDTGALDWLLGGEFSDWTVLGDGFAGQHAPEVHEAGRLLALMNNGAPGTPVEAAIAMAYDLDPDTLIATPRWQFDDAASHLGVILGNVSWIGPDDAVVNWGSSGVLQRVNAAGEVRWEVDFGIGEFAQFSDHVASMAGAVR